MKTISTTTDRFLVILNEKNLFKISQDNMSGLMALEEIDLSEKNYYATNGLRCYKVGSVTKEEFISAFERTNMEFDKNYSFFEIDQEKFLESLSKILKSKLHFTNLSKIYLKSSNIDVIKNNKSGKPRKNYSRDLISFQRKISSIWNKFIESGGSFIIGWSVFLCCIIFGIPALVAWGNDGEIRKDYSLYLNDKRYLVGQKDTPIILTTQFDIKQMSDSLLNNYIKVLVKYKQGDPELLAFWNKSDTMNFVLDIPASQCQFGNVTDSVLTIMTRIKYNNHLLNKFYLYKSFWDKMYGDEFATVYIVEPFCCIHQEQAFSYTYNIN